MNDAQLRAELDQAYSSLEKADAAGDTQAAQEIADYARSIEDRVNRIGSAQQRSRVDQPALAPAEDQPDVTEMADQVRIAEQSGEDVTPALEGFKDIEKEASQPELEWGDYGKSMKGSLMRTGADFFRNMKANARQAQQDALDEFTALNDQKGVMGAFEKPMSPAKQAEFERLRNIVESGEEIDPTFYGTLIKPFFTSSDNEPVDAVLRKRMEEINADRTPYAKAAAQKPFFNPDTSGLNVGDPSTWTTMFENTAMPWEDLDAFNMNLASNAVPLGASIVTARVGGKAGAMTKARQLRASGVVNPQIVRAQAAKAGTAVGTVAATGAEYVMVRDNVHSGLQEAFRGKWDDEELWAENPKYQELLDDGYSSEYAKQVVADEISLSGGQVAGVASAALGAPMNMWWSKLGLEKASGRAGNTIRGAIGESVQEGIQEATEQVISNVYESKFDPKKPWTEGLANSFFGGWAMGGAMGGAMGALSGTDSEVALNKDQKKLKKRGWDEWRKHGNARSTLAAKMRDPQYMSEATPAERVADFEQLEELQLAEAKAFKLAEPQIRKMQKKYGGDVAQVRRTDKFSQNADRTIQRIEMDRKTRRVSEDRVATDRQIQQESEAMIKQVESDYTSVEELTKTKEALDGIVSGELTPDMEQQESLVAQGYARFRNKSKTDISLTPAGKAARETIPTALQSLQGKIQSGFAGEDKRKNMTERQRLESMTPEAREAELHTDEKIGGPNQRAYNDIEKDEGKANAYAMVDVDSLKWVNDNMGHGAGDNLLKAVVKAAKKEGVDLYHIGGDEFALRADSEAEAEQVMQAIAKRLESVRIEGQKGDGKDSAPPRITWGTGDTLKVADDAALEMKETRQIRGLRAARDTPPIGYELDTGVQPRLPLMSYEGDSTPEIENLTLQLKELANAKDDFSRRRRADLVTKLDSMIRQSEERGLREAARAIEETLVEPDSNKELNDRWSTFTDGMKQAYELRAREFYVPLVGEDVSARDVFKFENGGNQELWARLPDYNQDLNGNLSALENSELFQRLSRIVDEGTLPLNLLRHLEGDVRKMQEMGMDASMTHALAQRVGNYLNGSMMVGSTTPFSGEVEAFNSAQDMFSDSFAPTLMLYSDPLMGPDYYNDMKKGDSVEVIINSQSIPATVMSTEGQSVVVRWDESLGKVVDPDTRKSGNTARFSKEFGWQGSARIARGGKSYGKQVNSWPGQARLGRRFNESNNEWETYPERSVRITKENKKMLEEDLHPRLRIKNRATKNEMRRAVKHARKLFSGYRNLPKIQLANTVADLPKHLQEQLAAMGMTGDGVEGMFDEVNPENGVWVVVGNVADKAKKSGIPFEHRIAEALVHESIGHYGLRGFMGSDKAMDQYMDAIYASFPAEVTAKGRGYGFIYQGKWLSLEARRMAAEEMLAEQAQTLIAGTPGYELTKPQKSLIRSLLDYIKNWFIDMGFGHLVRLDEMALYEMIWHSQDFAHNAKGWEYRTRTGSNLVPFMKDADIFQAGILTEFLEGTRQTNGAERKEMKANGLQPLKEVLAFNNNLNKNSYISMFKKMANDKKFSQEELEFTGVEDFLENLTYRDWLNYAPSNLLPEPVKSQYKSYYYARFDEDIFYEKRDRLDKRWHELRMLSAHSSDFKGHVGDAFDNLFGVSADGIGTIGGMFGVRDILKGLEEDAKAELNAHAASYPTENQKNQAILDTQNLLDTPVGKKVKIPRTLVEGYLRQHVLKIDMMPSGGYIADNGELTSPYLDESLNLDITPANWDARANNSQTQATFSSYTTILDDRYQAYVFFQQQPHFNTSIDHGFGMSMDGSFMHLRHAEADLVDGGKGYLVMESQSDVFQGKDKASTSNESYNQLKAELKNMRSRMAASERIVLGTIGDAIFDALGNSLRAYVASPPYPARTDADKLYLLQDWRNALQDDWAAKLKDAHSPIKDKVDSDRNLVRDDVRAFEYLDNLALSDLYIQTGQIIRALDYIDATDIFEDLHVLNRDAITEESFKIIRRKISREFEDVSDRLFRVIAKPELLKKFLGDLRKAIGAGGSTILDSDVVAQKIKDSTKIVSVELGEEIIDAMDLTSPSHYPDREEVESWFYVNAGPLKEFGWHWADFTVQSKPNNYTNFTVKAYGADPDISGDPFDKLGDVIKAVAGQGLSDKAANKWHADEANRRKRVRQSIRDAQATRYEGGIGTSERRAQFLSEINWERKGIQLLGPWNSNHINQEFYADRKTREWVKWHVMEGDLLDYLPTYVDRVDENGVELNFQHPDYIHTQQNRTFNDAMQADAAANQWLKDEQEKFALRYYKSPDFNGEALLNEFLGQDQDIVGDPLEGAGPGFVVKRNEYSDEWDRKGYEPTRVYDAHVPTKFSDSGEVLEKAYVTAIVNGLDLGNYYDEDPIDTDWHIKFTGSLVRDYYKAGTAGASAVLDSIYKIAGDNLVAESQPIPLSSVFHTAEPDNLQDLEDQLRGRPEPDFLLEQKAVKDLQIDTKVGNESPIPFGKLWENYVMMSRVLDQGRVEPSPMQTRWQEVAMKFAMADAVRKGYDSVIWQTGEASISRGGWGYPTNEVQQHKWVDYEKAAVDGKGVYQLTFPDGKEVLVDPSRMPALVGKTVSDMIVQEANEPVDMQKRERYLRARYEVKELGADDWVVVDTTENFHVDILASKSDAEARRVEVIQNELSGNIQLGTGRINGEDIGQMINTPSMARVPQDYVDSFKSGSKLAGARTGYDVILPSVAGKVVKRFKGKVTEGLVKVTREQEEEIVGREGGRRGELTKESQDFLDTYPNLRISKIDMSDPANTHGARDQYVLISDNGLATGNIHEFESDAERELAEFTYANQPSSGIRTYEVKITDEMREYFGKGHIPMMSYSDTPSSVPWKIKTSGEGDLYLQRVGTNAGTVHKTRQSKNDLAITLDQEVLLPDYAYYLLQYLKPQLQARQHGTAQQHITVSDVDSVLRHALSGQAGITSKVTDGNPVLERLAEKIGAVPHRLTLGQKFDEWRKDAVDQFNQSVFDRFYGIKRAMDRAGWDGGAEYNPYITARLTTSLDSQMRAVMNYGYPVWEDGMMVVKGDKGLLDILAPVSDPEMLQLWSMYMVARRSERLMSEGRESLITSEEIAEALKLSDTYPVFDRVAQEYAEFNKKVIDYAEAAGMINPETRPMWEHADYVPFYRVVDERVSGALSPGVGVANQRNPIKQLKGGKEAIADIPMNIIQNITQMIDGAGKNQAALYTIDALKGTGIITKVPSVQASDGLVPMGQFKQILIKSGLNPDQIPAEAIEGMRKMTVMKPMEGEGVLRVMRNGKNEYYQTTDRLLWESMTMINMKQFGKWMSLFRGPKRFLTASVTLDPGFMIANYMRDLLSSFVQSRDIGPQNLPSHMLRSAQGLKQAAMKDETFRTMMSSGAAFDSGYINYGDPSAVHRAIRKAQRKKGFRVSVLDTPARIFEFYKELGAAMENSNRVGVYNETIAAGGSKKQAAFESKDLMDFSMGGSHPVIQFLIQSVPFLGARLQGLHRLGRGFADDPVGFAAKGLMLTMAGMALWFQFKDDERYIELEEWDKDTYFHFWIGNEHYRIPKPFEAGAIFNTIPERAFEYLFNESDDAHKLVLKRFGHMLAETFAFNPIPQTVGPAFESAFNHNFFTGRQIVSPYAEKTMAPEQYRPTTSPTLVEIARSLPEGMDGVSKKLRSPLHLESLFRGYTGTLGRYALMGADALTREAYDLPLPPSWNPSDYPVSGRFYRGTDDQPGRTKYEEAYYDLLRKVGDVKGSMTKLEKEGNEERMMMLAASKEPYVGLASTLESTRQEISQLNGDSQNIWNDPELTPDEKRELIDEIRSAKNELYKAIYEIRPTEFEEKLPSGDDLTFLIEKFGVDKTASRIESSKPATASLMRDISIMNSEELGSLSK